MFFIFGWGHKKSTDYGPVEEHECQNCHNTRMWNLTEIASYFSLFFVPIFAHDKEHWLRCPICTYGIKLDKEDFESYKSISELNKAFVENGMTNEEKDKRIKEIHLAMDERYAEDRRKSETESGKWESVVAEKADEELLTIITRKRGEYSLAFLIAAEREVEKRKLNP